MPRARVLDRPLARDLSRAITGTAGQAAFLLGGIANVSSAFSTLRTLAPDFEGSLYASSGGAVATLFDQSGNGRNLTQGSAPARPTLSTLGGKACLALDGNQFLAGANLASLIQANNGLILVSFVATSVDRGGAAQAGRQVVGDAVEGGSIVLKNTVTSPRGVTSVQFDGAYKVSPGLYVPLNTPLVAAFRKDATSIYNRINLAAEVSALCGNLTALGSALHLGGTGSNRFIGQVLELITFSTAPSDAVQLALISDMMRVVGSPTPPDLSGYPSALSTGPSGTLTPVAGTVTLSTPGEVYENRHVTGAIIITANNVTVRSCRVDSTDFSGIKVATGAGGATISHCHIDGQTIALNGIYLEPGTASCTVEHNDVHDVENGINLLGTGHAIRHNYVHGLNKSTGDPHYDGIEMNGNLSNTVVSHNTVFNDQPQASAIMINNAFGAIDGLLVDDNYVRGGTYSIYVDGQFSGVNLLTNVTVSNNAMGPGTGSYINVNSSSPTLANNIRVDSGFTVT